MTHVSSAQALTLVRSVNQRTLSSSPVTNPTVPFNVRQQCSKIHRNSSARTASKGAFDAKINWIVCNVHRSRATSYITPNASLPHALRASIPLLRRTGALISRFVSRNPTYISYTKRRENATEKTDRAAPSISYWKIRWNALNRALMVSWLITHDSVWRVTTKVRNSNSNQSIKMVKFSLWLSLVPKWTKNGPLCSIMLQ